MQRRWVKMLKAAVIGVCLTTFCSAADAPDNKTVDKIAVPGTTVEFKLVKIPAGKITMKDKGGKEKEVEIKSFWMGQYEVTWDEYEVFYLALDLPEAQRPLVKSDRETIRSRPSVPYEPPDRGWGHDGWPAGSIWDREAKRYCDWLSTVTKHKYRLPTEAEWEYACRAGGPPVKPDEKELKKVAWYTDNTDQQTMHVGKKDPNAWGLYDMLGNVGEWVIMMDGTTALAGGSFQDEAVDVSSSRREPYSPKWQRKDPQEPKGRSWLSTAPHAGFRVVRED